MASIDKIYRLIEEGEKSLKFCDKAVLFVGPTGTGKSCLVRHLATDNTELVAVEEHGKVSIDAEGVSKSMSQSQTLYPQLFTDGYTNYYDCPGFKDTRGASHEISANYLLKKVTDAAKEVKIVVVCDNGLLFRGDRFVLIDLLRDITVFIKDTRKLAPSIFLVAAAATVVGKYNSNANNYKLQSYEDCMANVAASLIKLKKELNSLTEERAIYNHEILEMIRTLLDVLVEKSGDSYIHLSVFRVPEKLGPLNEDEVMMDWRRNIVKMIQESPYTPVHSDDFSYVLSPSRMKNVSNLKKKVDQDILNGLESVYESIYDYLDELTQKEQNSLALYDEIVAKGIVLKQLETVFNAAGDRNEFMNGLLKNLTTLGVKDAIDEGNNIESQFKYIQLLNRIVGQKDTKCELSWLEAVREWQDKCSYFKLWYQVLYRIYEKASTYEIQRQRFRFSVSDVAEWGYGTKDDANSKRFKIAQTNIASFLPRLRGTFIEFNEKYPPVDFIQGKRLDHLNYVLDVSLFENIGCHRGQGESGATNNSSLTFTGHFITVSQVQQLLNQDESGVETKQLNIFCWNTLFIDCDVKGKFDFSIIAPRIEVIGSKIISLEGLSPSDSSTAATKKDGHGEDGQAGCVGERAGKFFCVTQQFTGDLTVDCSGGQGQDGQSGGDGADGQDGQDRPFKQMNLKIPLVVENQDWFSLGDGEYRLLGEPGCKGGDAGAGGDGGDGGVSGLFFSNFPLRVKTRPAKGGRGGLRGRPGIGGKNGCDRRIKIVEHKSSDGTCHYEWLDRGLMKPVICRAQNGDTNTDGKEGREGPIEIDLKEFELIRDNYKKRAAEVSPSTCLLKEFQNDVLDALTLDSM